jgi:hypothetical protein
MDAAPFLCAAITRGCHVPAHDIFLKHPAEPDRLGRKRASLVRPCSFIFLVGLQGSTGNGAIPGPASSKQQIAADARQQGSKAARQQGSKAARQQGSKAARQQGSKAARQQGSKTVPMFRSGCIRLTIGKMPLRPTRALPNTWADTRAAGQHCEKNAAGHGSPPARLDRRAG